VAATITITAPPQIRGRRKRRVASGISIIELVMVSASGD